MILFALAASAYGLAGTGLDIRGDTEMETLAANW